MKKETKDVKNDIDELEKKHRRDNIHKIILIIIIIILLLLHWFLCGRLGKIGFGDTNTSTTITDGNNVNLDTDNLNVPDKNITGPGVIDVIELVDGDINNIKGTELNIFKNELFDGEKIIAPGSNGKYTFLVKNLTGENLTYDIDFSDSMTNPINMKYTLKIDNIYIRGNKDSYVMVDDLQVDDVIVVKDSVNAFTLEWYWEHNDAMDTYVGTRKEEQSYTLDITIDSELYGKEVNE